MSSKVSITMAHVIECFETASSEVEKGTGAETIRRVLGEAGRVERFIGVVVSSWGVLSACANRLAVGWGQCIRRRAEAFLPAFSARARIRLRADPPVDPRSAGGSPGEQQHWTWGVESGCLNCRVSFQRPQARSWTRWSACRGET